MLKLSNVMAANWRERVGVDRMRPVPEVGEARDRVSLGEGRAAIRTRDHAAIVYWNKAELLDTVVPYLAEGLRAGDKVVYVADDLSVEDLGRALAQTGVQVDAEIAAGRLLLLSARDAFFSSGSFDVEAALQGVQGLAEQAKKDGFARVRFSVEMTYLLAQVPGMERGAEFEARANAEVFARFPFVCICSFNATRDVPHVLEDVLRTHPVLISNGMPLFNPYYRPWSEGKPGPAAAVPSP
jgi:chemotaxis family two-component system sensor kinase Cph1